MKRILITGKNSYIGTSVEKWLLKTPTHYQVDTIDMKDESWKNHDFSQYDVVFHVAGIAHRKETKKNKELYYKVNRDLAYKTAQKAKNEGASHFVFLSSMSVYGLDNGIIKNETIPKPKSNYGKSKLEAEKLINSLSDLSWYVHTKLNNYVKNNSCIEHSKRDPTLQSHYWMLIFESVNRCL